MVAEKPPKDKKRSRQDSIFSPLKITAILLVLFIALAAGAAYLCLSDNATAVKNSFANPGILYADETPETSDTTADTTAETTADTTADTAPAETTSQETTAPPQTSPPETLPPETSAPPPETTAAPQVEVKTPDTAVQDNLPEEEADFGEFEKLEITADAAIVIEYDSGKVLWEKNASMKLFPASLTKMLSCITALEKIKDLDETVKISRSAAGRNNSFFTFNFGDEISLGDLVKAALITSHNNATIALAEYVSGNEAAFIKEMNQKAISIGAFNTSFQSTNGLDSNLAAHLTTAQDMALIAKYCMENKVFRDIVSLRQAVITINGEKQIIYNTNKLLYFDYIQGIKTGFTNKAGYCMAIYSERLGLKTITAVLNCEEDKREGDILKLINWANDNYENTLILDAGAPYKEVEVENTFENDDFVYNVKLGINTAAEESFDKLVSKNDLITITDNFKEAGNGKYISSLPVQLPVNESQQLGMLNITINGLNQKQTKIISGEQVDAPYMASAVKLKQQDNRVKNILIFLIAFYFFIFILIIIRNLVQRAGRP
jgi:serine-type D-Ala-D-Ala carboxypeptidase (penicillin-binding protein 5/6)